MMTSSEGRVKFIKTKVSNIPTASQSKFHQIWITKLKVTHVQVPVPKWGKTKKCENILWVTKRGKRDYKKGFQIRVKRFQIGAEITSRGKKDWKPRQELQIGAEHYCRTLLNGLATSVNSARFVKQGRKRDSQSQSHLPKSFIPF